MKKSPGYKADIWKYFLPIGNISLSQADGLTYWRMITTVIILAGTMRIIEKGRKSITKILLILI